jgi:tRNA-splicing ligase RtcB (3'-phosphate/5'-hydroxy nucleic acid ligase)
MKIEKVDACRWRIPPDARPGMRVPGIVFADDALMEAIRGDLSLEQVANTATLPGVVRAAFAMPDIHQGYGFPIGGVVATRVEDGVISPGGVGYDINCGVRLLRTDLTRDEVLPRIKELVAGLFADVPTGVGSRGKVRLSREELKGPITKGARWAVERGMGDPADLEHVESRGCLPDADPSCVGPRPFERGKDQLGTLGSGNHFLEVQYVQEVFDGKAAAALGLFRDQVTVMIHTGSRGFGHQVCTDYLQTMEQAVRKYQISLPDRQLACAPIGSPEVQDYLGGMRAAANFAWVNRTCLAHWAKEVFLRVLHLPPATLGMGLVYDVAHNIVKIEEHEEEGKRLNVAVHRKGATRAFPPGHPELPAEYREVGQPVLIPGDMGRYSFVLVGTQGAMAETFGSTCHGAGRMLSRAAAIKRGRGRSIQRELEDQGVIARACSRESMAEEMPEAYKDVADVVRVCQKAGISRLVAKLKPIGVIKG